MDGPRQRSGPVATSAASCQDLRHNHSMFAAYRRSIVVVCALTVAWGGACRARGPEAPAAPIRLVDLYKPGPERAANAAGVVLPPPVEWRFASPKPSAWTAGPGVQGLTVRDGRLVGRATADVPVIDLERPPSDDRDVVHEVQVRLRASGGANLAVVLRPAEKVDTKLEAEMVPIIPWPFNSPLVAGDEMRTYVLRTTASVPASFRHVLIRPTDAPGATFEIESVRVVTRREHLAGVSAGLGWHGMSEIYREALVARAPDALSFDVHLPARARLELAVGTIENAPVTFRVRARDRGKDADDTLLERTVTTAHRWETATVDLSRLAGRDVTLSLVLASERPRALGFWGTPVIRSDSGEERRRRPTKWQGRHTSARRDPRVDGHAAARPSAHVRLRTADQSKPCAHGRGRDDLRRLRGAGHLDRPRSTSRRTGSSRRG